MRCMHIHKLTSSGVENTKLVLGGMFESTALIVPHADDQQQPSQPPGPDVNIVMRPITNDE